MIVILLLNLIENVQSIFLQNICMQNLLKTDYYGGHIMDHIGLFTDAE